ncbi:MAG: S53 family peptidase [Nitrososphaerota archaeon]|nr:S53 family peptidase [Nitrososphaerota archaeon]
MKKTLLFTTIAFSFILAASPLALVLPAAASSSDFNYVPFNIYQQVSSQAVMSPSFNPLTACGGFVCYAPSFLHSAYRFPTSINGKAPGTGETIVIVDAYGSPTIATDLGVFDSVFGIPAPPSFTIICPPGGCPTPSYTTANANSTYGGNPHGAFGWSIETSLDVEYSHAMAPGAAIVLDVASSSSGNAINAAEARVISNPAYDGSIMSQSFGIPEYAIHNNNAQILQAEANYVKATSEGWTIFASAGDSGATNGLLSTPNANFPASDPLVTSVGGTMGLPYPTGLAATGCPSNGTSCTPSYGGEQVWNEPAFDAAGGGAPSLIFTTVPTFQEGLGLTARTTPDVSYNAAVDGGVLVVDDAACPSCAGTSTTVIYLVGGTSAGSPQWAAIAALADQTAGHPLGSLNTAIYNIGNSPTEYANDFHDITTGNNTLFGTNFGFSATTGWDAASGWGTPIVSNLISDLATST